MNLTEIFRTRIEIDGNPAINEIGKLELEVRELKAALKSIPKETEEWKTLSKQAQEMERLMNIAQKTADKLSFSLETQAKKNNDVKDQITLLSQAENKDEAQIKALNKELKSLEMQYERTSNSLTYQKNQISLQSQALKEVQTKLKQTAQTTQEYTTASEKLTTVENKLQEVRQATGLLGMTMNQLKQVQKEYNQQITNLTFGTDKYNEVKKSLQEVNSVIQHQQNDLRDTRTQWQKLKDGMRDLGTATMGNIFGEVALRAFDAMTQALVGTVTQAAKLSDELADIARFTGFSAEETLKLNQQLSEIQTRTGTGDLREIVMVAGQLGVAKEDILGFVESIDKASVALSKEFGGSSEAVANALGKLKGLFAETKNMNFGEAMSRIGSALTAAGSASAASAPQIADFTQRIGAIGELGPKLTESLGLGTALLDLGLTSEIASSGLQALFLTAGKEAEAFAKQIGITKEEFIKLQNENPNEMILELAKSFKGLSNEEVMAGLQRMGITSGETVKVMALLKDNTDKVVSAQKLMRDEFDNNTKLQEAFNIKMKTFGAQVDLAKKEINGLVASISSALLPVMTKGIELIVSFVMILKAMPKFLNDNKVAIGSLVVAMLAFNAQAIIAQANILRTNFNLLTLQATTRAYAIATGIATAAQTALNVAMIANPVGLVVAAIALLIGSLAYLYTNSEKAREVMDTMWQTLKGIANTYIEVAKIMFDFYTSILTLDFSKAFDTLQGSWDRLKKSFQEGATPVINAPIQKQSMLFSKEYKAKQGKISLDTSGLQQEQQYVSPQDDAALIEANKERAAKLKEEEDKKKAEKNKKSLDDLKKLNEERSKLTKEALQNLQDLELQMMAEGEEKELLQLKRKYEKLYGEIADAQEKGLSNTLAVQQTDALDKLSAAEKEKILEKYRQSGIDKDNAEQDAIVATRKKLAEKELTAIEANKANKDARATLNNLDTQNNLVGDFLATDDNSEKAAIQEQIKVADFDHKQVLLDNENWFQEQKLAILQKYGLLTEEQENAILLKQKEAEKQKTDNTIAEAERRRQVSQAEFKATLGAASSLVGALGNLQNALGKDGEEWIDFKNALTLAQIGIDTASAISSLTAASSANPSNAVTFGAAGAIQFATGIASILANIAKASSILSGANKPKAPTSKAANVGSSSSSGESRYFDGGNVPRRQAEGYTGGSSIYEPIPMTAHGGEYIFPNWMMKLPPVANFVAMSEGVRTGKLSEQALYNYNPNSRNNSPQNGFFEGGQVPQNNNPSAKEEMLMSMMRELMAEMVVIKNTKLKAYVVARDVTEIQNEENQLDIDATL